MSMDWKSNLSNFFGKSERPVNKDMSEMAAFIANVALPAFEEISAEIMSHGRVASIRNSDTSAGITIQKGN
ncbi:MAG: hypothetical protein JXN60_00130, partial [Lentisphaerae bacterium]|nr:hypothetical protein [Lentisphaerota bacterium]